MDGLIEDDKRWVIEVEDNEDNNCKVLIERGDGRISNNNSFEVIDVIEVSLLISIKFARKNVGSFKLRVGIDCVKEDFFVDINWKEFRGIDSRTNGPSDTFVTISSSRILFFGVLSLESLLLSSWIENFWDKWLIAYPVDLLK